MKNNVSKCIFCSLLFVHMFHRNGNSKIRILHMVAAAVATAASSSADEHRVVKNAHAVQRLVVDRDDTQKMMI